MCFVCVCVCVCLCVFRVCVCVCVCTDYSLFDYVSLSDEVKTKNRTRHIRQDKAYMALACDTIPPCWFMLSANSCCCIRLIAFYKMRIACMTPAETSALCTLRHLTRVVCEINKMLLQDARSGRQPVNMQNIPFPGGHPSSYGGISKNITEASDRAERDRENMKVTYRNQLQDQMIAKKCKLCMFSCLIRTLLHLHNN